MKKSKKKEKMNYTSGDGILYVNPQCSDCMNYSELILCKVFGETPYKYLTNVVKCPKFDDKGEE